MRKLLAAGIIAAGSLGVSVQANAASTIYEINGTFGSNEQGCTQITLLFGGSDCSYGRNRPGRGRRRPGSGPCSAAATTSRTASRT